MPDIDALLAKVGKGVQLVRQEISPDNKDVLEAAELESERKLAILANEWLLIDLRKKYGRNIVRFMWVYFIFSGIALGLDGYQVWGFDLPESVLVAIVGGTAVSVLGVVGTVAAGLFRPPTLPG